jgi:hypothetical protein
MKNPHPPITRQPNGPYRIHRDGHTIAVDVPYKDALATFKAAVEQEQRLEARHAKTP